MSKGALDYTQLAAVYDDYCVFAGDVAFFQEWAGRASGAILELMAGTGRISLPLVGTGVRLTCVDSSLAMLAVLEGKLRARGLHARVLCADAAELPLRERYSLVLLPFQGFTELTTPGAQLAALRAVAGVLADSGRFVCTSHNPAVRLRSADGAWHEHGEFPRSGGGVLRLALRARPDERSGLVVGEQRIEVTEPSGATRVLRLDLRFSLVSLERLTELAGRAGLCLLSVQGDYDGGDYDSASSPAIIAVFGRGT
jgi:SAM-dependent methyltransferase